MGADTARDAPPTAEAQQPGFRETWLRTAGIIVLVILIGAIVWRVREVVTTVLLATVIAYVLRPVVALLSRLGVHVGGRRRSMPPGVSTGIVFIALALLAWAVWKLSAPSIARQIDEFQARWPRYQAAIVNLANEVERYHRERLPTALRPAVDSWLQGAGDLVTRTVVKGVGLTVHGVGLLVELLLVPILVFYFLADGPAIRRQALFFVPTRYLPQTERALDRADDILQRYVNGTVILCVIAFALVTAGLWAVGVDFYLLLGIFAGLTRAVPVIGPVVGALPIVIVVFLTKSTAVAAWALILFSAMHVLESKLLMPAVLGRQLDLHPVLIIVALLIGAQMGGLLGVFVAAPVLAAIKAIAGRRPAAPEMADAGKACKARLEAPSGAK